MYVHLSCRGKLLEIRKLWNWKRDERDRNFTGHLKSWGGQFCLAILNSCNFIIFHCTGYVVLQLFKIHELETEINLNEILYNHFLVIHRNSRGLCADYWYNPKTYIVLNCSNCSVLLNTKSILNCRVSVLIKI